MCDAYDRVLHIIRSQRFNKPQQCTVSVDDIEFMIDELVSDGELTTDEYIRLRSEIYGLKS